MKRSRFSEEQIFVSWKVQWAELCVQELCCKHAINDATFYKRRSKYDITEVSDAR